MAPLSLRFHSRPRGPAGREPVWRWLLLLALVAAPGRAWDSAQMAVAAQQAGPLAVAALPALQQLITQARAMPTDEARLQAVNAWFNQRVRFRSDLELWGEDDHWTSPLELLARGEGDCEDYAIAKYATLRAAGVPVQTLRLVYVRAWLPAEGRAQAHMVLAYHGRHAEDPLILDNLQPDVLPASRRGDLVPVFSFNSVGLWQGGQGTPAGDPLARLSRWRQAWARTVAEGF